MKKRCRKGEEHEINDNTNKNKKITLLSSSPAEAAATWSELPLDALGEIKKKLFWGDHIRFSGVCKSWLAAQHAKRASDVLPWLLLLDIENLCSVSYNMYEPSAACHLGLVISQGFYISQIFDGSLFKIPYGVTYLHGCIIVSSYDQECTCSYFAFFSIATRKFVKLPRLYHPIGFPTRRIVELFTAVSTNPTSPDCVFLALHKICREGWSISTFRHGDKLWTTPVSFDGVPCVEDVLFIRGVFYFLLKGGRLGSYDIATMKLKVDDTNLRYTYKFDKFFVLDEELVVTYIDEEASYCIRRYDWFQKVWVPLESLKGRSLFLSKHSAFVDTIDFYGVSPNKIYIHKDRNCYVYSLENGKLCSCTSSGLTIWDGINYDPESSTRETAEEKNKISIWVEPPDRLLQNLGTTLYMTSGVSRGRRPIDRRLNKGRKCF